MFTQRITLMVAALSLLAGSTAIGCKKETNQAQQAPAPAKIRSEGQEVQVYIEQLRTGSADSRKDAAEWLGRNRIDSPEAIAALTAALDDPNDSVRQAAADALVEIRTPEAIEALRNNAAEGKRENRSDWEKIQRSYDRSMDELKKDADKGKEAAGRVLERLGEKLQDQDSKEPPR